MVAVKYVKLNWRRFPADAGLVCCTVSGKTGVLRGKSEIVCILQTCSLCETSCSARRELQENDN